MECLEYSPSTGQLHLLLENIQPLKGRDLVFCVDQLNDDFVHTGYIPGQQCGSRIHEVSTSTSAASASVIYDRIIAGIVYIGGRYNTCIHDHSPYILMRS